MINFIVVGLLFTAIFDLFIGLMTASNVSERCNGSLKWLLVTVIALSIGFAIAGAFLLEAKVDADIWNNGFCPTCEEHWIPNGATKPRNGSVTKYYYCPGCYNEITQQ